jgi:hypothetical protein
VNLGAWGPAEWIAVIGALSAVATWGAKVILVLGDIARTLFALQCWMEVLGEEFPELRQRAAQKMGRRPVLRRSAEPRSAQTEPGT